MHKILVADWSQKYIKYFSDVLKDEKYSLLHATNREEGENIIHNTETIDILFFVSSEKDPVKSLSFIRLFKKRFPYSKIFVTTISHDADVVAEIFKTGADEFQPIQSNKAEFQKKINSLVEQVQKTVTTQKYAEQVFKNNAIIGESPVIQKALKRLRVIAESNVESCLIYGESGTGKELVARSIYQLSPRNQNNFVALNCAGTPESLIDSEFFGFEKGSFTGASHTTIGKFELANKGVLFLDEISEMPIHLQGRLLRVLENREIVRIGGAKPIPIDVMILAATNRDLIESIDSSTFRADVFYRLNMIKIELPPLRQRKADIPVLSAHFLNLFKLNYGIEKRLSENAMETLMKYDFPGNIRELKNMIFSAALFSRSDEIPSTELRSYIKNNSRRPIGASTFQPSQKSQIDDKVIMKVLESNNGNITQTARLLGYTREGLSRRLKRIVPNKQND